MKIYKLSAGYYEITKDGKMKYRIYKKSTPGVYPRVNATGQTVTSPRAKNRKEG